MHSDTGKLPDVTPEERAAWDGARRKAREEIRTLRSKISSAAGTLASLERDRNEQIRKALLLGVSVSHLADDAGLKPARIYQIRDSRR